MPSIDAAPGLWARRILDSRSSTDEARRIIAASLGLDVFLRDRRILEVGELPLRCELYESSPGDPLVLFLPGLGTYTELFCELLHGLSRRGFNVAGIDLRGHGYSGGPRGCYTVEAVAADVSAVLDRLQADFEGPVAIFGSSLGSMLALACAERDRRIRALLCHTLVLTECPPDVFHLWGWASLATARLLWPWARVSVRGLIDVDRLLAPSGLAELARFDDRIVWSYPVSTLASVFNHRSRAYRRELGFGAAVLIGDRDEVVSLDYQRHALRAARHPFELILVPGAGHMLPLDRPADLISATVAWLRRTL